MASPENLTSIEPWMFRSSVADSWLAEYMARDAETLTKALQKSLSAVPEDSISPFYGKTDSPATVPATPTSTVSGHSGSDQEPLPKRQRVAASKRKSRASKRSQTTFITADPANFRQMVQQVTGVRFGGGLQQQSMTPVLKPEPQRAVGLVGGRLSSLGAGCLPTLDTSEFLLNQQQHALGPSSNDPSSNDGPGLSGLGPFYFSQPVGALDDASFGSAGLDFDTFSSFPTLESSWKVM